LGKIKDFILKIWRDPVWSKLIAGAIAAIVLFIYAQVNSYTFKDLYGLIINVLTFNIPVFLVFSIIGSLYLFIFFKKLLFKKSRDPIWDEEIGNFSFEELYKIMQRQEIPARTSQQTPAGFREEKKQSIRFIYTFKNTFK
jgi:hypothetical protein